MEERLDSVDTSTALELAAFDQALLPASPINHRPCSIT